MSWAEIKKAINSNISKSLDVLITEKCNELQSKLNSVYNTVTVTGNIPSVKSVQRGFIDAFTGPSITISSVNVNKSIVIINGGGFINGTNNITVYPPCLSSLTSTSITIMGVYNTAISWQVIEFY